jgi:hypothetical protein
MARDGQRSQPVISWGPYNLSAGTAGENQKYGTIWLIPYNTGKDPAVTNPGAYAFRSPIPDLNSLCRAMRLVSDTRRPICARPSGSYAATSSGAAAHDLVVAMRGFVGHPDLRGDFRTN